MAKSKLKKVVLSRHGEIKIGNQIVGSWEKEYVAGSSHFRPSEYEGMAYYSACLDNDENVDAFTTAELRVKILKALK